MEKTLEQRIEGLEKRVAELERRAPEQPMAMNFNIKLSTEENFDFNAFTQKLKTFVRKIIQQSDL